jgi:hypothetical protein
MLFLDEDDLLYADHVEQLLATCLQHQAKVAYSYSFEIPSEIDSVHKVVLEDDFKERFNRPFQFVPFMMHNFLPINALLFHRSLYEECGGFDPELDQMEDWNLWVRFSLKYRPFVEMKKTTALYRVPLHPDHSRERRSKLIYYLDLARKKQANLTVTLQVSEIQEMYQGIADSVSLEEVMLHRTPRAKMFIRLGANLYSKVR